MFGAKKADVDYFKAMSMSQAVDELLNPTAPNPNPPVKEYTTSTQPGTPDSNIAQGTTWINDINNDGTVQAQRRNSYKKWWMGVMINQDRSIREKLTFFWHNHFSTEANEVGNARYVYKHHNLLRLQSLGILKRLVMISRGYYDVAYLNGQLNTKAAPDENYARELRNCLHWEKRIIPIYGR